MAGKRKGRTGLEWLLEKGSPKKAEENGSDGAAAPAAPVATGASAVDAALALLDLPPSAAASTVLSRAPAESSLAHHSEKDEPHSGEPNKRTLDPVANALALVEPEPAPKSETVVATDVEPAASEKTTKSPAARTDEEENPALAKTAKSPAARTPDDADGVIAKGAKPAPEPAEETNAALADAEDDAPSRPPASPAPTAEAIAALAAHKKALASGRSTRAFPRVVVPFEVRFKKGSQAAAEQGRNVSAGGFFVETKKILPEGEVFQAQLFFPKRERKLSVIAEVMWVTAGDPENLDRFPPGMGCKFLDVDERDAPFIQGVIDEALAAGSSSS